MPHVALLPSFVVRLSLRRHPPRVPPPRPVHVSRVRLLCLIASLSPAAYISLLSGHCSAPGACGRRCGLTFSTQGYNWSPLKTSRGSRVYLALQKSCPQIVRAHVSESLASVSWVGVVSFVRWSSCLSGALLRVSGRCLLIEKRQRISDTVTRSGRKRPGVARCEDLLGERKKKITSSDALPLSFALDKE